MSAVFVQQIIDGKIDEWASQVVNIYDLTKKDTGFWFIIDTKGALKGKLHSCRRFEMCRDVVVLVSKSTPKAYLDHLKERNYGFHVVGNDKADLRKSLMLIMEEYGVRTVLTDTGRILSNLLLEQGLADEISLLVHPVIVGRKSYRIFDGLRKGIRLEMLEEKRMGKGYVWLNYGVSR